MRGGLYTKRLWSGLCKALWSLWGTIRMQNINVSCGLMGPLGIRAVFERNLRRWCKTPSMWPKFFFPFDTWESTISSTTQTKRHVCGGRGREGDSSGSPLDKMTPKHASQCLARWEFLELSLMWHLTDVRAPPPQNDEWFENCRSHPSSCHGE